MEFVPEFAERQKSAQCSFLPRRPPLALSWHALARLFFLEIFYYIQACPPHYAKHFGRESAEFEQYQRQLSTRRQLLLFLRLFGSKIEASVILYLFIAILTKISLYDNIMKTKFDV